MDISISNNDYYFKVKAVGLILHKDRILLVQINNNGFFCCPGGHVKINETVQDACLREIEEEVKVKVKIIKELCVVENFFEGINKNIHEIAFYYIVEPLNFDDLPKHDFVVEDPNDGKLDFRWFDINHLQNVDFRPKVLKEKLISKNLSFEFITINQLNIFPHLKP